MNKQNMRGKLISCRSQANSTHIHTHVLLIEQQGSQVPPIRARPLSWCLRPVNFDNKVSVMVLIPCGAAQQVVTVAGYCSETAHPQKKMLRTWLGRNPFCKSLLTFFFFCCVTHQSQSNERWVKRTPDTPRWIAIPWRHRLFVNIWSWFTAFVLPLQLI